MAARRLPAAALSGELGSPLIALGDEELLSFDYVDAKGANPQELVRFGDAIRLQQVPYVRHIRIELRSASSQAVLAAPAVFSALASVPAGSSSVQSCTLLLRRSGFGFRGYSPAVIGSLCAYLQHPNCSLRSLVLFATEPADFRALGEALAENASLRTLNIAAVPKDVDAFARFCQGLQKNASIERLSLAETGLPTALGAPLFRALLGHPSVRFLDLSGNRLGDEAFAELARLLPNNNVIVSLRLGSCDSVTVRGLRALTPAFKRNLQIVDFTFSWPFDRVVALDEYVERNQTRRNRAAAEIDAILRDEWDCPRAVVAAVMVLADATVTSHKSEGKFVREARGNHHKGAFSAAEAAEAANRASAST